MPTSTHPRVTRSALVGAVATLTDLLVMVAAVRGRRDSDEPDLWQHDLTGALVHWIEVGQPDERRLAKACGRAERVTVYCYGNAAEIWWAGVRNKLARLGNLTVWRIPAERARALAQLAQRSMQWQVSVQDSQVWLTSGEDSLALQPQRWMGTEA